LTERNYSELTQLYEKYSSKGLEIIAFPCNNFMSQEPGTDAEILDFTKARGVTFPLMAKVDCGNTPVAEPLFPFLCQKVSGSGLLSMVAGIGLKWNFTKFLCDKDGVPVKRFEPTTNPLDFEDDIVSLLLPANDSAPAPAASSAATASTAVPAPLPAASAEDSKEK
jgi:glutathione peroxidase